MNYQTRLILGAFKEFILSLDRTDALLVLILILCMGWGRFGRLPAAPSYGFQSLPAVEDFQPSDYRASSQLETPSH
jgi:hypothetical protein